MPVLTYTYDTLTATGEQPKIDWNLPDWIDNDEAILKAGCDPSMDIAGVLEESWRGHPQYAVIVKHAAIAYGDGVAVSEQTIYDVKPKD